MATRRMTITETTDGWMLVNEKGEPPKGQRIMGNQGDWLALADALVADARAELACVVRRRLAYVPGKLWNPCMLLPPMEIDSAAARDLSAEIRRLLANTN